jgi:hypothetical protein
MPKTVSFVSLTLSALRLVRSSRSAWLFFIPFGGAVLLAGFVPHEFRLLLEGQSSRLADGSLGERWFLLSITLLAGATLLRIACRGPLVLILDRERRKPLAGNTPGETSVSPLRAIRITFLFEISYWIALGLLGLVLALPLSIAWKANPAILPTLARFALFFFLCLSLYLFLLKEFSFYYSLLGRSRFRSALELGERLLRRHTFLSLLFGLYATLFSLLLASIRLCSWLLLRRIRCSQKGCSRSSPSVHSGSLRSSNRRSVSSSLLLWLRRRDMPGNAHGSSHRPRVLPERRFRRDLSALCFFLYHSFSVGATSSVG